MGGRARVLGLALAAFLVGALSAGFGGSTPGQAANWFEMNTGLGGPGYDGAVPQCDEPFALWKIQSRFARKEGRFWASDLEIVRFDSIHQVAFRPWGGDTIPRRFCSARALTSDGKWRMVHYSIVEDGGMIGASWGVEWCVVGVDRNWANNPACRMAKP
jgi:hypothetical protein